MKICLTEDELADLHVTAEECGVPPAVYAREHAVIVARIQSDGAFWPRGDCPNPFHMYAYALLPPDTRSKLIPSECPDCGATAPIIEQTGKGQYEITLPEWGEQAGGFCDHADRDD